MMAFTSGINCYISCYIVLIQMLRTSCGCVCVCVCVCVCFRRAYGNNGDTYVRMTPLIPPVNTLSPTCPVRIDLLQST